MVLLDVFVVVLAGGLFVEVVVMAVVAGVVLFDVDDLIMLVMGG